MSVITYSVSRILFDVIKRITIAKNVASYRNFRKSNVSVQNEMFIEVSDGGH